MTRRRVAGNRRGPQLPIESRVTTNMRSAIFALAALALVVPAAAQSSPRFTADAGPFKVLTIDRLELHDAQRHKDLPVKIYYPQGAGPFPVIVFSHGLYGSKAGYFALGRYWACYGFVSIHPSHAESMYVSGCPGCRRAAWEYSDI